MFNKTRFVVAQQVCERKFYPTYKKLIKNQWRPYEELKEEQDKQLKHMINFAYENVPYYHKLFRNLKLRPEDIRKGKDLEKLPILTKSIIKENWEDFKPVNLNKMNFYENKTSGATGSPFKYRLSKYDRHFSQAMLFRGWGYGNYKLGDKIIFLAGASLVGKTPYIMSKLLEFGGGIKKLAALDMDEANTRKYVDIINSYKPKFLRGYASSLTYFATYIEENDLEIVTPSAVFTTSENLYPHMREKIQDVLGCEVYNNYGLNDGGVSAYECSEHNGLHIDAERSIMEVVDKDGVQLENGEGTILATSLYNYAMPFIRYTTSDIGNITDEKCPCGRGYKLLKEIVGRKNEILITPNGRHVHGSSFIFTYMIKKYKNDLNDIIDFQIIQKDLNNVNVNLVCKESFDNSQLDQMREKLVEESGGWNVEVRLVDEIDKTKAGKSRHIINEMNK